MSLSRVIGLVPTRLLWPWLIRLCQVSRTPNAYVDSRGGEQQAGFNTHDRNVVFPTASSPSSNMDIVCGSMESANTRVLPKFEARGSSVRTHVGL